MTTLGFIGLGVMGASMAGHLLAAGHQLVVYNRTRAKAEDLLARGARWCDTPAELAAQSEVVFTILGYPQDVEQVYLGPEGLLTGLRRGSILVDMTTSSPALARRLAAAADKAGGAALDAPVSGGDRGAREAALSIMVGGEAAAVEQVLPLFQLMGRSIVHQGPAGAGQHCKLCNQIAVACNMIGVCEALAYARTSGLDPRRVLDSIRGGAAGSWSLSNLGPRILDGDFAPGFFVRHIIKDLAIALDEASAHGLDVPGLTLALERYRALAAGGHELDGTQALYRLYS